MRRAVGVRSVTRQVDLDDCGPACLLMMLNAWGGNASFERVRDACGSSGQGTTLLQLATAARQFGLDATGVEGTYDALTEEVLPCVVHLVTREGAGHYAVATRRTNRGVTLADPAHGMRLVRRRAFEEAWRSRAALVVSPGPAVFYEGTRTPLGFLLAYLRPQFSLLWQVVFLGVAAMAASAAVALIVQRLVDHVIPLKRNAAIAAVTVSLVVLLGFRAAASYWRARFLGRLSRALAESLSSDTFRHLYRLPKRYFDTHRLGDINTRIGDIFSINQSVAGFAGALLMDVLAVAFSLALVIAFSRTQGLLAAASLVGFGTYALSSSRRLRERQGQVLAGRTMIESENLNALEGIDHIVTFSAQEAFVRRLSHLAMRHAGDLEDVSALSARMLFIAEIATAALTAACLGVGSYSVVSGELKLGALLAVYSLLVGMIVPIVRVTEGATTFPGVLLATSRLNNLSLSAPEHSVESGCPVAHGRFAHLALRRGTFSWANDRPLWTDVDLVLQRGEMAALVGPSGTGKSTLVEVLQRRYLLHGGELLVDGRDACEIDLLSYRRAVAVVTRDTRIFKGTIFDNIALGDPDVGLERIAQAIESSGLLSVMGRLPRGLGTMVGEGGLALSDGERQVVGFLRVLARRPPVILVDEGFSGLDASLESLLLEATRRRAKEGIVLIVTHSDDLASKCDVVFDLRDRTVARRPVPPTARGA